MSLALALTLAATLGGADPRVRTLAYQPDRVTPIEAFMGYQIMIRFGDDERIENVAIGDGARWLITPNKGANLLFIKPLAHAVHTNMTVVTDHRGYLFDLDPMPAKAVAGGQLVYSLRFSYPPEALARATPPAPPADPPPERRNGAYTYIGSRALLPSLVFDDGRFTYFRWPDGASTPAVFLLAADGSESLAGYSFRDGYQVVQQLASRFRLRSGKEVTTIINDGWREPSPGEEAPRPHDPRTAREALRAERSPMPRR